MKPKQNNKVEVRQYLCDGEVLEGRAKISPLTLASVGFTPRKRIALAAILGVILLGCGSASETGSGETNLSTSANLNDLNASSAAAIGSVFGRGGQSSAGKSVTQGGATDSGSCTNDPGCFCRDILQSQLTQIPSAVKYQASGDAGKYGSDANSIDLGATDFCALSDGTENTGLGPDSLGRFASFSFVEDISGSCQDSEGTSTPVTIKTGSLGAWRYTLADANGVAYKPQILGTFFLESGEVSSTLNCTFNMKDDGTFALKDCSGSSGKVSLDEESNHSCDFAQ